MKRCIFLCLLWLCLCVFTASVSGGSPCTAEVYLPTVDIQLQGNGSALREVKFQVVSNCPGSLSDYYLKIDSFDGHKENSVKKSVCSVSPSENFLWNCDCNAELSCTAKATFPRQPRRTWKFSDIKKRIADRTVVFNVTYPTILEQFHALGQKNRSSVTVNKGDTIPFTCQWSEGNPQRRILLLGPDNSILKEVDVTEGRRSSTRHDMKIISCSDGGQYRCQVEGTEEVKSLTVLVRCPLTFKEPAVTPPEHVVSGEDATFSFRATSYTLNVRSCQLKKPDDTTIGCNSTSSVVTVNGPLPDVDIIVTLKDVTEQDEGAWQLTVSNPTPSQQPATARFNVTVTNYPTVKEGFTTSDNEEPSARTQTAPRDYNQPSSQGLSMWTFIAISAGGVFCVAVVAAVVMFLCRRKTKVLRLRQSPRHQHHQQQQQRPSHDDDDDNSQMIINDLYDTSDNCQMITNTLYQGAGRMGVAGTGGSSLYEDVDQARGRNLPPRPYRSPGMDVGDYVDQEEIRRTERKQRNQQPGVDVGDYVDQEEIRRTERKQRNQQPETDAAEAAVYVDREEIRRKKRKQRNQQPD